MGAVFKVLEDSGDIQVAKMLDYETSPRYELDCYVIDDMNSQTNYTVQIDIVDVNEAPLGDLSYDASIAENSPVNSTIPLVNLRVRDPEQERLTYVVVNSALTGVSVVSNTLVPTLKIVSNEKLNYEMNRMLNLTLKEYHIVHKIEV